MKKQGPMRKSQFLNVHPVINETTNFCSVVWIVSLNLTYFRNYARDKEIHTSVGIYNSLDCSKHHAITSDKYRVDSPLVRNVWWVYIVWGVLSTVKLCLAMIGHVLANKLQKQWALSAFRLGEIVSQDVIFLRVSSVKDLSFFKCMGYINCYRWQFFFPENKWHFVKDPNKLHDKTHISDVCSILQSLCFLPEGKIKWKL